MCESLEKDIALTNELLRRCKTLSGESVGTKALIKDELTFFYDLKMATDGLNAWMSNLHSQVEAVNISGRPEALLRLTIEEMVECLVQQQHSEVRAICSRLNRYSQRPTVFTVEWFRKLQDKLVLFAKEWSGHLLVVYRQSFSQKIRSLLVYGMLMGWIALLVLLVGGDKLLGV